MRYSVAHKAVMRIGLGPKPGEIVRIAADPRGAMAEGMEMLGLAAAEPTPVSDPYRAMAACMAHIRAQREEAPARRAPAERMRNCYN